MRRASKARASRHRGSNKKGQNRKLSPRNSLSVFGSQSSLSVLGCLKKWWYPRSEASRATLAAEDKQVAMGSTGKSLEDRRRGRTSAAVAGFGSVLVAVLFVGVVAFSRPQPAAGGGSGVNDPRGLSHAAVSTAAKEDLTDARRKLERRPEIRTRGGQLAYAPYSLVAEYPHDPKAFTQGLVFFQGHLYESTGLFGGKSSVRRVDPITGEVKQIVNLEPEYFGEGMTIFNDEIISITWKAKVGFKWDINTFKRKQQFSFSTKTGQGWGITTDGKSLIVSDGSALLYFWDPETMEETRRVEVTTPEGRPLKRLNELEMVKGYIFANVWFDNHLYKIDPETGKVVDVINFTELYPRALQKQETQSHEACFNGIAYDPDEDVLYLTGKLWPRVYKVKLDKEKAALTVGESDTHILASGDEHGRRKKLRRLT